MYLNELISFEWSKLTSHFLQANILFNREDTSEFSKCDNYNARQKKAKARVTYHGNYIYPLKAYSELKQTSKMKLSAKIIDGF